MAMKKTVWKTKGMNKDSSSSSFSPEFAFDNMNLRLSTNENNTLMSWVNEKGTAPIKLNILLNLWKTEEEMEGYSPTLYGIPIGVAVLNSQLVVFTTRMPMDSTPDDNLPPDHIYVFTPPSTEEGKVKMNGYMLYGGNLNFDVGHPLETLVDYEAEHIQKVYWTDGLNQPRLVNIGFFKEGGTLTDRAKKKLRIWNHAEDASAGEVDTFFDFVPTINFNENTGIEVNQSMSGNGTFPPGVIQYCYTYYNKYGQQTNVIDVTPLYYLAFNERGASPDEVKVTCSFNITIRGIDTDYDYVRLYSIQRSSYNGAVAVKILSDIPIPADGDEVSYIDNGTTGSAIDPYELLYVGGREINALTMIDKDKTLFLGNIEELNATVDAIQNAFNEQIDSSGSPTNPDFIKFYNNFKILAMEEANGFYAYTYTLRNNSHRAVSTFKGGETYRFGFQLQKVTGEWSQPIWIGDVRNNLYPNSRLYSNTVNLVHAECDLPLSPSIDTNVYKRIRPVIVYPNIQDRSVLCQGVLNPTVFNAQDRKNGYPFAQASWYFRPYMFNSIGSNSGISPYATTLDKEKIEGNVDNYDFSIDSGFTAKTVYVLVAEFESTTALDNMLRDKRVYFQAETQALRPSQAILGGILLERVNVGGYMHTMAALVSEIDWYSNTGGFGVNSGIPIEDAVGNYARSYTLAPNGNEDGGKAFQINANISVNEEGYLRYTEKVGDHSTYVFKFSNGNVGFNYYKVTFYITGSVSTFTTIGYPLNFRHYDSLFTDAEASNNFTSLHKVEIMGSSNTYDSVTAKSSINDGKNNTQFFIDQSIVTLNSPDLEFDTEVQTWGTENLNLRVIGAIPITANISSHSIFLDSNMLGTNHNKNNSNNQIDLEFGTGELPYNVKSINIYNFSGNRLIAEYLWNDVLVTYKPNDEDKSNGKDGVSTSSYCVDYLIFPWHKSGALNDDTRTSAEASSLLKTKKESNLLFSYNTEFLQQWEENEDAYVNDFRDFTNVGIKTVLTENAVVTSYKLPKQWDSSSEINYYPNIDKVLYNSFGYYPAYLASSGEGRRSSNKLISPVSMKYLSSSHFVIALKHQLFTKGIITEDVIPVLPAASSGGDTVGNMFGYLWTHSNNTFWGDSVRFGQDTIDVGGLFNSDKFNFLWLGELYKDVDNRFGGTSKEALLANNWLVAGEAKYLKDEYDANDPNHQNHGVRLVWEDGDTFYQRYDCLKTYAFTKEDPNQIVEILSFMCETHVNIDGRYDKLRGQAENHVMDPTVFNLINGVYSQQDNFFTGKKIDTEDIKTFNYPNQIAFTMRKTPGEDVDMWTHIAMGSTVDLDGDKGRISKLARLNNQIISFQDTGLSQILYNENVQIASKEGVPIELANSDKVQGKKYFSDDVGCSNKWSVVSTPSGLYFMDSVNKAIYLFNGQQLSNLSVSSGFDSWAKTHIPNLDVKWNPKDFSNFVGYYDRLNQDVLFIDSDKALAYSEKTSTFTSFYSYGQTPYFANFNSNGVWLRPDNGNAKLWLHRGGDYCKFFDKNEPYWMTLIGNPEPLVDKTFTNLEFRATVDSDGVANGNRFDFHLPFDTLDVWNEYQHGISQLKSLKGHQAMLHHWNDNVESLKRKFRIWHCDIPRDNAPRASDEGLNISKRNPKPLNRIRNPWAYLKLTKEAAKENSSMNRTEIHDMVMTYYS